MSFFKNLKSLFKNSSTRDNSTIRCQECGCGLKQSDECCPDCGLTAQDRVNVLIPCCVCGAEIVLDTKMYKAYDSRNLLCYSCTKEVTEAKNNDEDDFFDWYKTCNVCGKQFKMGNNKLKLNKNNVCLNCELESIKEYMKDECEIYKEDIKYCIDCGKEFYSKNNTKVCDSCKN